ncbi:MAG: hypothetical protein AAF711_07515 [Planctomycetota bacterium]
MAERNYIQVVDLRVDPENPRLAEASNGQNKALRAIASELGEKLIALADDMVEEGTDLGDLPFVVPMKEGEYLVVEGNRRLAAIRALESPEIFDGVFTKSQMQRLRALSGRYHENPLHELMCVVVKNRQEADHWVRLRHTGENGGRGRVAWNAQQGANYRTRIGEKPNAAKQVLDFLESQNKLDAAARREVPITNLGRLLHTPEFREAMGLGLENGKLELLAAATKVAKALHFVAKDLSKSNPKRTKVDEIKTSAQRIKYAKKIPKSIKVKASIAPGGGRAILEDGRLGAKKKQKSPRPVNRPREMLIPRSALMSIDHDRIASISNELRTLKLEKAPNAISVMLRVFFELSIDYYIDEESLSSIKAANLAGKGKGVVDELHRRGKLTKGQRTAFTSIFKKESLLGPTINDMHAFIHSRDLTPSPVDLRAYWDNLEPILIAIWTP